MIDTRQNVLQQHAMDISTAVSGLDVSVRAGAYEDLTGSAVVINAAGVQQGLITDRMEMLPMNIPLVRSAPADQAPLPHRIRDHGDQSGQRPELCRLACRGLRPSSAHRLLAQRFVPFPRDGRPGQRSQGQSVEATVLGEHGSTQVLLFSSVRIDGLPVSFDEQGHPGGGAQHLETLRGVAVRPDRRLDVRHRCGGRHPRRSSRYRRDLSLLGGPGR